MDVTNIEALTFDVFGTVVDWRGTIISEGERLGQSKGLEVDWASFADSWRAGYAPSMDLVRQGNLPWTNIDVLHRMILNDLLIKFRIESLNEAEIDHLNRVWHRLIPWPDVIAGLEQLRRRFIVATLSNGNVTLLTNMAKRAGLPWDCILSAELVKHYKPDREVYQNAAELLGIPAERVMMVAAHKYDLLAAQAVGMKTAFVSRPDEFGPGCTPDSGSDPSFNVTAKDLEDLAYKLGA